MSNAENARIYLAHQRSHTETNLIRQYQTLGPDTQREPVGPLWLLSDDTLRAGASLKRRVETNTAVVLLPLMGSVEFATDEAAPNFLEPGQSHTLWLPAGGTYTVSNPYETETVNVLQLCLSSDSATLIPGTGLTLFNLIRKNELQPLFALPGTQAFIGRYDGRAEDTISVSHGLFVFVLSGAFEVANRLLHERDGLAFPTRQETVVEFEALSNDAVLMAISL